MVNNKKKKKVGIIAGSVLAVGIAAGGITAGILAGTAKVTLSFNTQDSGIEYKDITVKKGGKANLPTPVRAGYKFLGWSLTADGSVMAKEDTKYGKDQVLYAQWTASTYTVNYVDEKGIYTGRRKDTGRYLSEITYQLEGYNYEEYYKFKGWSENKEASGIISKVTESGIVSYNMPLYGGTLYAIWEGAEIEVVVSGKVGEGDYVVGTSRIGEEITLPNTEKITNNRELEEEFIGYIISKTNGTEEITERYKPGARIEIDPRLVIKSGNKNIYRLRCETTPRLEKRVEYVDYDGTPITNLREELGDPSEIEGYEFRGWYTTENWEEGTEIKTEEELKEAQKNGLVILYAKREAEYIEIELDYTKAVEVGKEDEAVIRARVGEEIVLPRVKSHAKTNLDFIGWRKEGKTIGGQGEKYIVPNVESKRIKLEAIWGSSFNLLQFNLNGGSAEYNIDDYDFETTGKKVIPKIDVKKLGYEFRGWTTNRVTHGEYVDESVIIKAGDEIELESPMILYAVYRAKSFEIEYDLGGNLGLIIGNKEAEYGSKYEVESSLVANAKDGYKLTGWKVVYEDNREIEIGTTGNITIGKELINESSQKIRLTAIWEEKEYKIKISGLISKADEGAIKINGEENKYDWVEDGVIVKYGSEVEIDTKRLQKKDNYEEIIGVVLDRVGDETNLAKEDIKLGAYGYSTETEKEKYGADINGIIRFTIDESIIGKKEEGEIVEYKINRKADEVKIKYNIGTQAEVVEGLVEENGIITSDQKTYYNITQEKIEKIREEESSYLEAKDYKEIIKSSPEGQYFSHWKVTTLSGATVFFKGKGLIIEDDIKEYREYIYGVGENINNINTSYNSKEIILEAVYVDAITLTIEIGSGEVSNYEENGEGTKEQGKWEDGSSIKKEVKIDITSIDINNPTKINRAIADIAAEAGIKNPSIVGYDFVEYRVEGLEETRIEYTNTTNKNVRIRVEATYQEKTYNIVIRDTKGQGNRERVITNAGQAGGIIDLKALAKEENEKEEFSNPNNYIYGGFSLESTNTNGEGKIILNSRDIERLSKEGKIEGQNIIVYVIWLEEAEERIVLRANNGTGSTKATLSDGENELFNENKEEYTAKVTVTSTPGRYTLLEPERDGYSFLYWTDGVNNYNAGTTLTVNRTEAIEGEKPAAYELNAVWEAKSYRVVYNLDGGSVESGTLPTGEEITFDGERYTISEVRLEGKEEIGEKKAAHFIGWSLNRGIVLTENDEEIIAEIRKSILLGKKEGGLVPEGIEINLYPVYAEHVYRYVGIDFGSYSDLENIDYVIAEDKLNIFGGEVRLGSKTVNVRAIIDEINGNKTSYANRPGYKIASMQINGVDVSEVEISWNKEEPTITVIWTEETYQITYHGVNAAGEAVEVKVDSKYLSRGSSEDRLSASQLRNLTERGSEYKFIGWHTERTIEDINNITIKNDTEIEQGAEDKELWAIYKEMFVTINFEKAKESGLAGSVEGIMPSAVKLATIRATRARTRAGSELADYEVWENDGEEGEGFKLANYNFAGWSYEVGNEEVIITQGEVISGSILESLITNAPENNVLTLTAEWGYWGANITDSWNLSGNTYNYVGTETEVHVPLTVAQAGFTINNENVTKVTLPKTAREIEARAIKAKNLETIVIPSTIERIGEAAIESSRLRSFVIGKNVGTLGGNPVIQSGYEQGVMEEYKISPENDLYEIVDRCVMNKAHTTLFAVPKNYTGVNGVLNLSNINFAEVTTIKSYALNGVSGIRSLITGDILTGLEANAITHMPNLQSLQIGYSVNLSKSSSNFLGAGITKLATITSRANDENIKARNNCLYIAEELYKVNCNLTSLTTNTIKGDYALEGSKISNLVVDRKTTTINYNSTKFLKDTLIVLEMRNLTETDLIEGQFEGFTKLSTVKIPNYSLDTDYGIKTIPTNCFNECSSLITLTLPSQLTAISARAFANTALKKFTFTESIANIGNAAFENVAFESIEIQNAETVSKVEQAVTNLSKTNVILNYLEIGSEAGTFVKNKNVTIVTLGNNAETLGNSVFKDCRYLTNITISSSVTNIEESAFYNCSSLKNLNIPDAVTSIGNSAFYNCSGLTDITIGEGVINMGNYAFAGCSNISQINYNATNCENLTYSSNVFKNIGTNRAGITVIIGSSVKTIPSHLFSYVTKLGAVRINSGTANIGDYAFAGCSGLLYLTMTEAYSSSIKTIIGSCAFKGCTSLMSITIPNSVTSIGSSAFSGCVNLTSLKLGKNVSEIEDEAFYNCNKLTSVVIPSSVTKLWLSIFHTCTSLKTVEFKGSVPTYLDYMIFTNCTSLTKIIVPINQLETYKIKAGNFDVDTNFFVECKDFDFTTNLVDKTAKLTLLNNKTLTNVTIPDKVILDEVEYTVTSIGEMAFANCTNINSITIPGSVTSIESNAFSYCGNLTSVIIEEGLTSIESYAFSSCTQLNSISIPNSLISIEQDTFSNCTRLQYNTYDNAKYLGNSENPYVVLINATSTTITSCTINPSTKLICPRAFASCSKLTNITIPSSVKRIGDQAFYSCSNLTSVIIEEGLSSIGTYAFNGCNNLTNLVIPDTITSIAGWGVFVSSNLQYNIYDNAKYIGNSENPYAVLVKATATNIKSCTINPNTKLIYSEAFSSCSQLTEITIPNGVKTINGSAFYLCSGLTSINIPSSVIKIEDSVFTSCTNLESIIVDPENTVYDSRNNCNAIIETSTNTLIAGTYNTIIPNDVTSIASSAFNGRYKLTSIIIPDSVTSIGDNAFANCTVLKSITIPNSVKNIGNYAFNRCRQSTIYFHATCEPSSWNSGWRSGYEGSVIWGYSGN